MGNSEIFNEGARIRRRLWVLWDKLDPKIAEKFKNITGKTGQYDVPDVLFQKRTSRANRVLLSWKTIKENSLTLEQLETFYGGVCVEIINEDYFNEDNLVDPLFKSLLDKIGSNDKVSVIVSFRNEEGDSGAAAARQNYEKFRGLHLEEYTRIMRNPMVQYVGKGDNSVWNGNLFFSVKGGLQSSYESHSAAEEQRLFNPAAEYANEQVCLDINISLSYFAMFCYDLNKNIIEGFDQLKEDVETYLKKRVYDEGNLFEYCINHYSLKFGDGKLVDPIQLVDMSIWDFKSSGQENSSVVCHNESVNKKIFYFDSIQRFILSPARPTNFFWSKHLSNMMQQNYTLDEYFKMEEERNSKRRKILS